jgi:hypothetical protein
MNRFNYDKVFRESDTLHAEIVQLKVDEIPVIEFPASLCSKTDIFEFVKREMPLDPVIEGQSWDALADSLGGGLERFRAKGVVILVRIDLSEERQISSAVAEFIDILFQIKNEQLPNSIRIYLCNVAWQPPGYLFQKTKN